MSPQMPKFKVSDRLILPFACPKREIDDIRIKAVAPDGTYFATDTSCAYIDRAQRSPLTLMQFFEAWNIDGAPHATADWESALGALYKLTVDFGNLGTKSERAFLDAYFRHVHKVTKDACNPEADFPFGPRFQTPDPYWVFRAPLPLPQAHLYAADPLDEKSPWNYHPTNMFKADFAFWTGQQLVAIEIDGGSHIGSPKHITKDRMLRRSGVQVVHILNDEILKEPERVIRHLLPNRITDFWEYIPDDGVPPLNPLHPMFF
jgi:hypothetical protein